MRQNYPRTEFLTYDPDIQLPMPVGIFFSDVQEHERVVPFQQHRKGQLTIPFSGVISANTQEGIWIVPTKHGLWIPSNTPHNLTYTVSGQFCFLYIDPEVAPMPSECCTLALTPLILEMLLKFAQMPQSYSPYGRTGRFVQVLLDELLETRAEHLFLPVSQDATIQRIADEVISQPYKRTTIAQWAEQFNMSERTFARFFQKETSLTFGDWRKQLHIMMAIEWLLAGLSVQIIAERLGYESVSAFITMFKKHLGFTPKQYLKRYQSK